MTNEKTNSMKISDKTKIMIVYLTLLFVMVSMSSCSKEVDAPTKKPVISLVLNTRLPIDQNGYPYFTLYNPDGQNIHRISGTVLIDGLPPNPEPVIVNWESSHFWMLKAGSTVFKVYKNYLNQYSGQWTNAQLPDLTANMDYVIPTINKSCYSNRETGEINTNIAPVSEMRGDTMTITARVKYTYTTKKNGMFETAWKSDSVLVIQKIILK
jgi:hypothetical protein